MPKRVLGAVNDAGYRLFIDGPHGWQRPPSGGRVRYDTMVATALALDASDAAGCTAQWRQLVDLVIQARGGLSAVLRSEALVRIGLLRNRVPVEQRRLAATQLAKRAHDADAVALFGADEPIVAAPILSAATLTDDEWPALIALIPPTSRALLRNRRDLPDAATRALGSFGLSDFALPSAPTANTDSGASQIRDLVARIEAFRQGSGTPPDRNAVLLPTEEFRFETNAGGTIDWVSGAPREALIGLVIAETAEAGQCGVDGQAAGAFRRRAPFRDARLAVAGSGPASGNWLISASPVFNPRDGRFAGYHGSARRPRPDEIAGPVARFAGTSLPVDSLRQLIHELRTPLNAILGFAEMIDQQLLGPATNAYRSRAHEIVRDGQRLVEMIDDLDHAARAGRDDPTTLPSSSDARVVIERVAGRFTQMPEKRALNLAIDAGPDGLFAGVAATTLDRMVARLIGAVLSLAAPSEALRLTVSKIGGKVVVSVGRPAALDNIGTVALLDPAFDPATPYPDAPLLGLGFSLRLIESLARAARARFAIMADTFVLTLPGVDTDTVIDLPVGTP